MSGRGSRRKGAAAEREVAAIFTDYGFPMKRNTEGSRGQLNGDIDNDERLYIEVRRRERFDIQAWAREVEEKTPEGCRGLLVYRRNGEPWRANMSLEDYIALLLEARRI